MPQSKVLIIKKETALTLFYFLIISGLAILAPIISFHQQAITGPLVNALLFISAIVLGTKLSILVALLPSLVALSVGLLPSVLAPMVPFIMFSNVLLIFTFDSLKQKSYWLAVILSALLKFIFLYSTSFLVTRLIIKKVLAQRISLMMSWPQLLTALAGGVLGYLFLKAIKRI